LSASSTMCDRCPRCTPLEDLEILCWLQTFPIHSYNPQIIRYLADKLHASTVIKQESLANAKVSARQPWYVGRNSLNRPSLRNAEQYQRNQYIVLKYFQWAIIPSLTMQVYLHSFSRCCLRNMRTSAKFRENFGLIAVQGHQRSMITPTPHDQCILPNPGKR